MGAPLVSIVVLNWNNYEDTAECLESLKKLSYPNYDVIVVDNGSTDNSGEYIEEEFTDIDVVFTGENLGFAGGNNIAIQKALAHGSQYIWLMNNDILISEENCLDDLVTTMETNNGIGIISSLILHYPKTEEVWFVEGKIDHKRGETKHDNWYCGPHDIDKGIIDNDYIPLCSALIRSEVFNEVGLLPERYFLYFEDVDYAMRVQQEEYRLATDTTTTIYHKVGGTSAESNPVRLYYLFRNRLLWALTADIDRVQFTISYLQWMFNILRLRIGDRDLSDIKAVLLGALHGFLRKEGKGPYP